MNNDSKKKIGELERELILERNVSACLAEREVSNAIRAEDAERKLDTITIVANNVGSGKVSLEETLLWMKEKGSSVDLNWGEDNNLWEVSWITGGKRYTTASSNIRVAILGCLDKCSAENVG